ncbi:MAG: fibronectin type III domain-containing protein [bacterium]
MNINGTRFLGKIMLAGILYFCLLNPSRALSDICPRSIPLAWDANSEDDDLAGYCIYYKVDSSSSYPECIKVNRDTTSYTIQELDSGETYVCWITAYDNVDLESEPSDELICRICYQDNDKDGYGNPDIAIQECTQTGSCPLGYVDNADDCNDDNFNIKNICIEVHIYPGQSIQAAIEAAHDGDVIIIHEGIYHEKINFKGKAITVKSADPNNPDVVAATIIDGGGSGVVITFNTDEESDSILSGITVQNGKGSMGGGIYCTSSPVITNCTITGNSAKYGGGICCMGSSAAIKNCNISENSSTWVAGGVYCGFSSSAITSCTISKNSTLYDGGGILLVLSSSPVSDCNITENSAGYDGGGIYCLDSSSSITNTLIHGNSASSMGGGIYCSSSNDLVVTKCTIERNSADSGGGIYLDNSSPTITDCLFRENSPGDF